MKKLLLIVFAMFVYICIYAQTFDLNGFKYSVNGDNNTVTLTGFTDRLPERLVIPDKVVYNNKEYDVTIIGRNAFFNCSEISSVQFSNKVFKIEFGAFSFCQNLYSIKFEDGLEIIERLSFNDCKKLKSIYISKTVKLIGQGAFIACDNLQSIEVNTDNQFFSSFKGSLYDKNYSTLLQFPGGLSLVDINETASKIGDAAFWGNTNIVSIAIPRNIQIISMLAFKDCSRLTSIVFPSTISDIDPGAFEGCTSLKEVICKDKVPNAYLSKYSTFEKETLMFGKLIVPIGALEQYKTSPFWGQFENIEEADFGDIVANEKVYAPDLNVQIEITPNGVWVTSEKNDILAIYSLNGMLLKRVLLNSKQFISLNPGAYIIATAHIRKKIII